MYKPVNAANAALGNSRTPLACCACDPLDGGLAGRVVRAVVSRVADGVPPIGAATGLGAFVRERAVATFSGAGSKESGAAPCIEAIFGVRAEEVIAMESNPGPSGITLNTRNNSASSVTSIVGRQHLAPKRHVRPRGLSITHISASFDATAHPILKMAMLVWMIFSMSVRIRV